MAHAHGKILLFGEHAVVHGAPAIAAGLGAGVDASVVNGAPGTLTAPAWQLEATAGDGSRVGTAYAALLAELGIEADAAVHLDAAIPAGAGLGSSAAMAVAVARAWLEHLGRDEDEDAVYRAAMASERIFHGNPSGLDHAAAMQGGVVRFVRGEPPAMSSVFVGAPLHLVVAQVAPGADTGVLVGGVATRAERFPVVFGKLFGAFGALSDRAAEAIAAGEVVAVGALMDVNHGLLGAIGVSTPALDEACARARHAGALGAKLTGAGGGGCILALAEPETLDAVDAALQEGGATTLRATLEATP